MQPSGTSRRSQLMTSPTPPLLLAVLLLVAAALTHAAPPHKLQPRHQHPTPFAYPQHHSALRASGQHAALLAAPGAATAHSRQLLRHEGASSSGKNYSEGVNKVGCMQRLARGLILQGQAARLMCPSPQMHALLQQPQAMSIYCVSTALDDQWQPRSAIDLSTG